MPVQKRGVAMVYQQFINYPAMTVYENPPRAAVNEKDAAFMVAAIAALSGDAERAAEAAAEARDLGDDHPATLRLIEQLAMDEGRAEWGVQTTAR